MKKKDLLALIPKTQLFIVVIYYKNLLRNKINDIVKNVVETAKNH